MDDKLQPYDKNSSLEYENPNDVTRLQQTMSIMNETRLDLRQTVAIPQALNSETPDKSSVDGKSLDLI